MTQSLFLDASLEFPKIAGAEVTMPEDPNDWPQEILQELYKQVSYIADFMPDIVMDRVDAEQRFGFGHVEVSNKTEIQGEQGSPMMQAAGVRTVRIPIVIKEGKLQPFDILVTEKSKMLPLTERRLRQSLFRPQLFDVTSRTPGDQSMISQLYPPYRQNYGFGGGGAVMTAGMGKEGSSVHMGLSTDQYNHYVDHMNALIQKSGGSMSEADHDKHTAAYNKKHGTSVPSLAEYTRRLEKHGESKEALNMSTVGSYLKTQSNPQGLARASKSLMGRGAQQIGQGGAAAALGQKKMLAGNIAAQRATSSIGASVPLETNRSVPSATVMKAASLLEAILPTINGDDYQRFVTQVMEPRVKAAYFMNKAATDASIRTLAKYEEKDLAARGEKIAQAIFPSVLQIVRSEEHGYVVKTASHKMWAPLERQLNAGQLYDLVGADAMFMINKQGAVTMADDASIGSDQPEADAPEIVTNYGIYRVQDASGKQIIGFCFPNLIDLDGSSVPLTLFTNGAQTAVQGDIAGIHVASGASLMEGRPRGHGVFYQVLPNGAAQATIPLTISSSISTPEEAGALVAETMDGREVQITIEPGITRITMADEGHVCVPDTFRWLPLDQTESVDLAEHPEQFSKEAAAGAVGTILIRAGGNNSFSISGPAIDKLAYDDRSFLDVDQAMFLLGGLGVAPGYATQKLGEAIQFHQPIEVPVSREIVPEHEVKQAMREKAAMLLERMPNLRQNLIKEAAAIPDPTAVDSVLSLGFINPENMMTFVSYLPKLDETQSMLCELLMASRLGMRELPAEALERAIRGLEGAIEGLNVVAFNQKN